MSSKKAPVDPEYQRFKRNYPKFPGVHECIALLHNGNVKGAYLEAVLGELETHAAEHIDEIVSAFRVEESERARILLLGLLAETKLSVLFGLT